MTDTTDKSLPNPPDLDENRKSSHRSFANLTIADQLVVAKRALENTTNNPQVYEAMSRFGFDKSKLEVFRTIYNEAVAAESSQSKEYGERGEAYAEFNKSFAAAKAEFSTLRKIARVALKKDPQKLIQIKADEHKKQSISGLLEQMQTCYENIFTDREVLHKLSQFGITDIVLNAYKTNYHSAADAYVVYYKEDSEAVNATRIRDEKIDALCDFMSDFSVIAKIAFAAQPDLLKQIS